MLHIRARFRLPSTEHSGENGRVKIRRPEVFISATTADLGDARKAVKEAILTLGCHPVEQTNFPPDFRSVKDMLRERIAGCDAVVHLVGKIYGAEPGTRAENEPRRSYTQIEYDVAVELGKPLYTFVAADDFKYGDLPEEDKEKRQLQEAHRQAVKNADRLHSRFVSHAELERKVRELQTPIEKLQRTIGSDRRLFAWIGSVVFLALALLGWTILNREKEQTEKLDRVVETVEESIPDHEFVTDHEGAGAPLFPEPDFSEFVSRAFDPPGGRLLNGTPVTIHDRRQDERSRVPWIEIEVIDGPDKGKRGWTPANHVRKIR